MIVRVLALLFLLLPSIAVADGIPVVVQLEGSALLPIGTWADSPVNGDESIFSPGPGGRLSVGFSPRQSRIFTVGVEGGYTLLGTYDWESSTARRGMRVDAEAQLWSFAAFGTLTLPGRGAGPWAFELFGALGVLLPEGGERVDGERYEYEFLRSTLLGRLGARGLLRFGGGWEAWAGAHFSVAPGAVRHERAHPSWGERVGNRERRSLTAVEPGLGLRYWFNL